MAYPTIGFGLEDTSTRREITREAGTDVLVLGLALSAWHIAYRARTHEGMLEQSRYRHVRLTLAARTCLVLSNQGSLLPTRRQSTNLTTRTGRPVRI